MREKAGEYTKSILSAVFIALLIRMFVLEAFKIPSASMVPSLLIGDHLFVNKFIYGLRIPFTKKRFFKFTDPERGDVMVFLYPEDESKDYIKRVVGLSGDTVRLEGEDLYINGEKVVHTPAGEGRNDVTYMDELLGDVLHRIQFSPYRTYPDREYAVPEDHLMVMGDNRDNSADSREWGFMPMGNIKGKAMFIWLSCGIPENPPETPFERGVEAVRDTLSNLPIIGWILPCDGHWGSIRWNRFGQWIR